jgi:integrase
MAKTLTVAALKKYRPAKARREIRDGASTLRLIIQPTGALSWAIRLRRPSGKSAKLTLGPVDLSGVEPNDEPVMGAPLTLAAARVLAAQVQRQRETGRDVVADRAAAKHRRRTAIEESAANTFAAAARRFIDEQARPETRRWTTTARHLGFAYPKHGGEPEVIRGGLAERWADRALREIDSSLIFATVDEVRRLGVPGLVRHAEGPTNVQARAMHASLSSMFTWAVKHRLIERSPCVGVHRPDAPPARDRVLDDGEIVKYWIAAGAEHPAVAAALKLLLLTGARLNEVAGMPRAELADDGTVWNLPGSRTKNRRAHTIPLAPLARDLIATVPVIAGSPLVFTLGGRVPLNGWGLVKQRLDAEMRVPTWRLHDVRRSVVTGMAKLGIRPDVIELCVNHASGSRGGIAGVYNRSELLPERQAALERWAAHVEGLVGGTSAKIVALR